MYLKNIKKIEYYNQYLQLNDFLPYEAMKQFISSKTKKFGEPFDSPSEVCLTDFKFKGRITSKQAFIFNYLINNEPFKLFIKPFEIFNIIKTEKFVKIADNTSLFPKTNKIHNIKEIIIDIYGLL